MGVPVSCPLANLDDLDSQFESILVRSISFECEGVRTTSRSVSFNGRDSEPAIMKSVGSRKMMLEGSLSFKGRELDTMISFKSPGSEKGDSVIVRSFSRRSREFHDLFLEANSIIERKRRMPSLEPHDEKHQAALKLQKTYKSFRTRRKLADCAVLVEQRWWKLLDFAELRRSSISFFDIEKPESAVSRWSRAKTRAAKVGKGLSKDEKARKLALQHWLEAIDPRHRYGHNLQFYYANWLHCESTQPFFYWLDVGKGKEVNLDRCPRSKLQQQCIKYLGPIERKAYEVAVQDGKFIYKQSGKLLDTREGPEDAKWIFVLSVSKTLYVGQKSKGKFQHSSFLAGGATLSAGRLVVEDGILKAVWPHSGHYLPTEENFEEFMTFLEERKVDLSDVQRSPADDKLAALGKTLSRTNFSRPTEENNAERLDGETTDAENMLPILSRPPQALHSKITAPEIPKKEDMLEMFKKEEQRGPSSSTNSVETLRDGYETAEEYLSDSEFSCSKHNLFDKDEEEEFKEPIPQEKIIERINSHKGLKSYQLAQQLSCKWTTGAGPRIGCVRDYPSELQLRVLEDVHLSPRSASYSPRKSAHHSPRVLTPTSLSRETTPGRSPLASEQVSNSKISI